MRLARQVMSGSLALVGALVLAIVIIAGSRLRSGLAAETRLRLEQDAQLVARLWTSATQDADAIADEAGRILSVRVTLVDSTGLVLGDSDFDRGSLASLGDHLTREEIRIARDSGTGCTTRPSASVGNEEIYCAVTHPLGFVRVSIPSERFRRIARQAQTDVLAAGVIALLGAVILAQLFSRSVSRPIVELRDVAQSMAAGDLTRRPTLTAPGEIGDMAAALSRMAEQLATRMEALKREESLLLRVIESLDEGIVVVDGRGTVRRMNGAARRILDVDDDPPFAVDRLPPERGLRDALRGILRGTSADGIETRLGSLVVAIAARPLAGGGGVLGLRDLTSRKRLEAMRRDFVANVSHELKTPLTVIGGYMETLSDPDLPEPTRREFMSRVSAHADRMHRIVDDLLDLSRYESGAWIPAPSSIEIGAPVQETFATAADSAAARRVTLHLETGTGADRVFADPAALRHVLSNLIENAVRHTSEGRVVVRTYRDPADRGVWVAVEDTGAGIAPEHLPRIFERFYRADPGRARETGGTGLGLSIVKHLVEAHRGEVRAESSVGNGTRISALFPEVYR